MPRENAVVATIKRHLAEFSKVLVVKRHGDEYSIRGLADLEGCINGRHFELEVKQPGEHAEPIQLAWLRKWARVGAITGVVHSWAEVDALFAEHLGASWQDTAR